MRKKRNILIYPFLFIGMFLILTNSCKKDENNNDPNSTSSTIKDIDGNVYHSVTIGTQVWMLENLKTTKYRNGDPIPNIRDETQWKKQTSGGYCDYDNNVSNANIYGRLYNWYAVNDSRNIAPTGWHVPSNAEWNTLINYLINNGFGYGGSGNDIAKSMAATTGWYVSSVVGNIGNDPASNNKSGFTALPSGDRGYTGSFLGIGYDCSWWSTTEHKSYSDEAYFRNLYQDSDYVWGDGDRDGRDKISGSSVRCVKDN